MWFTNYRIMKIISQWTQKESFNDNLAEWNKTRCTYKVTKLCRGATAGQQDIPAVALQKHAINLYLPTKKCTHNYIFFQSCSPICFHFSFQMSMYSIFAWYCQIPTLHMCVGLFLAFLGDSDHCHVSLQINNQTSMHYLCDKETFKYTFNSWITEVN